MTQVVINFALIIIASMYCGVMIGRRGAKKDVEKAVAQTLKEVEVKERQLASDLQGELGKIRDSIITSARAYQNAVRAIEDKLAPPTAYTIGDPAIDQLPEKLSNSGEDESLTMGLSSEKKTSDSEKIESSPFVVGDRPIAVAKTQESAKAISAKSQVGDEAIDGKDEQQVDELPSEHRAVA